MNQLIIKEVILNKAVQGVDFLIARVTKSSGPRDPLIISDLNHLSRVCYFAEEYKELSYLISSGSSVVIVGSQNESRFDDFPTLVVNKEGSLIKFCHPKYDPIGSYYENLVINNLGLYQGWNKNTNKTYFIDINFKQIPSAGEFLIIPRLNSLGVNSTDSNFLILFQSGGLPTEPSIDRKYILSDIINVNIDGKTLEQITEEVASICDLQIVNSDIYLEIDNFRIDCKQLLYYYDFGGHPSIEFLNKQQLTQDVYYLRSITDGVLRFESKLLNENGRLIQVEIAAATNKTVTVSYSFLGTNYTITGDLDKDSKNYIGTQVNEFLTIESLTQQVAIKLANNLNSFNYSKPSDDNYLVALKQFYEFDENYLGIWSPANILINHFDYLESYCKSINALALFTAESPTESDYIRFNSNYEGSYIFSGTIFDLNVLFTYIKLWIENKYLPAIPLVPFIGPFNDDLGIAESQFDLRLKYEIEFTRDLVLAYLNYNLSSAITAGDSKKNILDKLTVKVSELRSNVARVDSIIIGDVTDLGTSLVINVDTTYLGDVYTMELSTELNSNIS